MRGLLKRWRFCWTGGGSKGLAYDFCNVLHDALPFPVAPAPARRAQPDPEACPSGASSTLLSAYRVPFMAVNVLHTKHGYAVLRDSMLCRGCTYTTHFSGIGSVEVAANPKGPRTQIIGI